MSGIGWKVWALRTLISWSVGSALAAVIAFNVSDYVVRANNSSSAQTFVGLQGSIDTLNETMRANTSANQKQNEQMSELLRRSDAQTTSIASLKEDLAKVSTAVQNYGIDIRIGGKGTENVVPYAIWSDVLRPSPGQSLFLELPGKPLSPEK